MAIGPDSYTANPGQPVASRSRAAVQQRGGSTGGGQGYGLTLAPGPAPAAEGGMGLLMKLGTKMLEPKVKQEQERAFNQGLYRAAQGEAVADIAKDYPAWTDIFGPNYVVEGARVGQAQAKASKLAAEAEFNLPTLAQQGPEAMQDWYQKRVDSLRTGNDVDDTPFLALAYREAPGVYRQHAKQHFKFRQEEADRADTEAITAAADRFENQAKTYLGDPTRADPTERNAALVGLGEALLLKPGESEKAKQRRIANVIKAQATSGKFHSIQGIKAMGAYEALDAELRDDLDKTLEVEGTRFNWRAASAQTYNAVVKLYQDPNILTAEQWLEGAAAINKKHADETGIQVPLITLRAGLEQIGQNVGAQAAAAKAAKTALDKDLAEQGAVAQAMGLIKADQYSTMLRSKDVGQITERHIQQAEQLLWNPPGATPEETMASRLDLIQKAGQHESKVVSTWASSFDRTLTGPNKSAIAVFEFFNQPGLERAREKYLSPENLRFHDALAVQRQTNPDSRDYTAAWTQARAAQTHLKSLSPKERDALREQANLAAEQWSNPGWFERGAAEDVTSPIGNAILRDRAQRLLEAYPFGPEGLKDRLVSSLANDKTVVLLGKHVGKSAVPNAPPIGALFNPDGQQKYLPQEIDTAFDDLLREKFDKRGYDAGQALIIRAQDQGGLPYFIINVPDKNGQDQAIPIIGRDILKRMDENKAKAHAGRVPNIPQPTLFKLFTQ